MSSRLRTLIAALVAAAILPGLSSLPASAANGHVKTDAVVTGAEGTDIAISIYRPANATAETPAPVILHSHGWGGSRTSGADAFTTELDRGYGVVSIDQRGFGASGGLANVEDPDLEGNDIIAVIDHVAALDWVAKDPGTTDDPVLFAMGGSYGGGYQFAGALKEVRDTGRTRFNALAPEITWFNLSEALAPQGVVRTAWVTALYAAGAKDIVEYVHPAFAYGASTGQWPDGTVPAVHNLQAEFFEHGPSGFVAKGQKLDIPMLVGQGASDNLFNLNQGWKNFEQTLTDEARERSIFISYNGGHALPNVAPIGFAGGTDACSGGFSALRLNFFDKVRAGQNPRDLTGSAYNLTTADGSRCVKVSSLTDYTRFRPGFDVQVTTGTMTTTGVGAPQHHEVASGPLTIAGVPKLTADVTTVGADQRVFFAISVGKDLATAQVVQNNMLPLRELLPVVQTERTIELPGIAVDVKAGEKVFLTVSPVSDMSFGHGSVRTPGWVGLEDLKLDLPVVP